MIPRRPRARIQSVRRASASLLIESLERRQLLTGLSATYYPTPDLSGPSVLTRTDADVNFD